MGRVRQRSTGRYRAVRQVHGTARRGVSLVTLVAPVFWYNFWAHTGFVLMLLFLHLERFPKVLRDDDVGSYERRLKAAIAGACEDNAPSEAPARLSEHVE